MLHLSSSQQKQRGAHYTPQPLATFVAKHILGAFKEKNPLFYSDSPICVRDPAIGDGELLKALVELMPDQMRARAICHGADSDPVAANSAAVRLSEANIDATIKVEDFFDSLCEQQPSLLSPAISPQKADLIIANPPYVRTQVLGAPKAQSLARRFRLTGRVDLSFPFILGIIESLSSGGIAGIITSNRFLTTKAGHDLRQRLQKDVELIHVWDLGDTRVFDAAVLPCILLLRKDQPQESAKFTSVYSISSKESRPDPSELFSSLNGDRAGIHNLGSPSSRYEIRRGNLDSSNDVWKLRDESSTSWMEKVNENTWNTLGNLTKVRVGVKTTADSVFIRDDWHKMDAELLPETLMPLVTHHLARRFAATAPTRMILYTHELINGKKAAIRLDKYPNAKKYLYQHQQRLTARDYVLKAGRNWYEIWVPQEPSLWSNPKIVFRDIAEKPTFWLDQSESVINGDCYWFTFGESLDDLYWLCLGVFNSSFIERFYDENFQNKLYSGRRRFMTQYVSRFPLPNPNSESSLKIIDIAKTIYTDIAEEKSYLGALDDAVCESFGLRREEV